ncbi:hypothetical protein TNCV_4833031 [Trichonephila clavipes]|nr:hypothetical protein TNCV_4833031 [Trichonephila clavipes]
MTRVPAEIAYAHNDERKCFGTKIRHPQFEKHWFSVIVAILFMIRLVCLLNKTKIRWVAGDGAFSQKDGRKSKTMNEYGSNQEFFPTERGGRTYPETRNALTKQSSGGGRGRTQEGNRDGRRQ